MKLKIKMDAAYDYIIFIFLIVISGKCLTTLHLSELMKIYKGLDGLGFVYGATFNNISVISWRSVLLVEETRVPGENHRPVASH